VWGGSQLSQFDELPEGWGKASLFEISRPKQWKTISKKELLDSGYPVYGANGKIGFFSQYNHEKSTILITCRGATCGTLNISEPYAWVNGNAMAIDNLEEDIIDFNFIFYALKSRGLDDTISGSAQPQITREGLEKVTLPLPPMNEQRRIVEKIEALTARSRKARAALDDIPALLDQFRQSVLAAAFRGDLTADWRAQNPDVEPAEALLERIRVERRKRWEENERRKRLIKSSSLEGKGTKKYKEAVAPDRNMVEVPEKWLVISADQITFLITDGKHGDCQDQIDSGFYFLSVKDLHDGNLYYENARQINKEDFLEVHFRTNLEVGDVLVTNAGTIGRAAVANDPELVKFTTFQKSVAILKPLKVFILSEYLALYVENAVSYLKERSSGTAVKNLLLKDLKEFTVALPSLSEQKEIVQRLEDFFILTEGLKENYQDVCDELDQLDRSILAEAFRGELVPQDPTDEPAALLLERIRAEREQLAGAKQKRVKGKG
jgi:type I restriction enzyme S subunit